MPDYRGLAVGLVQVALRAAGQPTAADQIGDLAGIPRKTPELIAYNKFVKGVGQRLTELARGVRKGHPDEGDEIEAALAQVQTRFERMLADTESLEIAVVRPTEFEQQVRATSDRERADLGGIGPQMYDDALTIVIEEFIAFAPKLPDFADVILSKIARTVDTIDQTTQAVLSSQQAVAGTLEKLRESFERAHDQADGSPAVSPAVGPVRIGGVPREASEFVAVGALVSLSTRLDQGGRATLVSLTGLRGVGKTQIAAAFARRCIEHKWPVVAWVNAESEATLMADLTALAARVVGEEAGEEPRTLVCRLRDAWNSHPNPQRLIVLDNLVDRTHVDGLLPDGGAATVIATTANAAAAISYGPDVFGVDIWEPGQAVTYLVARTGLADEASAAQVAEELGFLPLGLAQAAWVITRRLPRRPEYGYSNYLSELREYPLNQTLQAEHGGLYPKRAAEAIALSLETILEASDAPELARYVLGVMAYLDPSGVPARWLDVLDDGQGHLEGVLDIIEDTSVVTPSRAGSTLVMHRLVALFIRRHPDFQWDDVSQPVGHILKQIRPLEADEFVERRARTEQLATHVETVLKHLTSPQQGTLDLCISGQWAAHALITTYLQHRAIIVLELLVPILEHVMGPDNHATLIAHNNLGIAYRSTGELSRAIPQFEQVLIDRERVLGPDAYATMATRNNLAGAYRESGDLDRAIPLYKQTLADRERVLGADHPATLTSRNNLAHGYLTAGDMDRAIDLQEQNVADATQFFGPDALVTLNARENLGTAYLKAGDQDRATTILEQTAEDATRVLEADDPNVLSVRDNLARAYIAAGQMSRAVPLLQQLLADATRILGPEDPRTEAIRSSLGAARTEEGHG